MLRFQRAGTLGIAIGAILLSAYLVLLTLIFREGVVDARHGRVPLTTDFIPTYAAALLLRRAPAEDLVQVGPMFEAEVEAAHAAYPGLLDERQARSQSYSSWRYPPHMLFFILPLGLLGYFKAYLAWLAVTAVPYVAAMWGIGRGRIGLPLAMGAPVVFFNLYHGQTGFLTAGLLGLGLVLLLHRPFVAGALIGLASVKPHLGLLFPLAMMVGGHWRAMGAASATVLLSIVVSAAVFGAPVWWTFFEALDRAVDGLFSGQLRLDWLASPLGAFARHGLHGAAGWLVQSVVSVTALVVVVVAWSDRRGETFAARAALLCAASLLVVPMVFLYDLTLLVPAAAWLLVDMQRRGANAWESPLVLILLALPLFQLRVDGGLTPPFGLLSSLGIATLAALRCRGIRVIGAPT